MGLEEITFTEFFIGAKPKLGLLISGCEPDKERYFKIKNLYFSLLYYPEYNNMHVSAMAGTGGLELFAEIRKFGKELQCETITFNTSEKNVRVNKIAEFYEAWKLKEVENFYPDRSKCIVWVIDI